MGSRSHGKGDEGHEAREQCGEGPGDAEGRALRCDRVHLRDQEEGGEGGVREGEAREDAREVLHGEGAEGCLLSSAGSLTSASWVCGGHERRLLLDVGRSRNQFERWALRIITLRIRGWISLYATDRELSIIK